MARPPILRSAYFFAIRLSITCSRTESVISPFVRWPKR